VDTTLIQDIPRFHEWNGLEELTGGNSKECKYRLIDAKGQTCILRVSQVDRFHLKHQEYANLVRLEPFNLNIPKPLQFGLCNSGSHLYMLLSWIDGTTVASLLPTMTEIEQFEVGVRCGATLRDLHQLSLVRSSMDWSQRYQEIEHDILVKYTQSPIRLYNETIGYNYLETHRTLLQNRPLVIKHGDYHAANLLVTPNNGIGIIDFDRCMISDPYEEFAILVWTAENHPAFARGQIAGYFQNQIPDDFFPLLAYYITVYAFEHVSWALGYGKHTVETIQKTAEGLLDLFDGYGDLQPKWYIKSSGLQAEGS
jgi:aminoglycoside phosphotransferase (APT) family kinase protein